MCKFFAAVQDEDGGVSLLSLSFRGARKHRPGMTACGRIPAERFSPGLCNLVVPLNRRGRRESRAPTAPAVPCAKVALRKHTGLTTGTAETSRLSPRNGFTAYFVLSPVSGVCCHRRQRDTSRQLDATVAAPGPHGFAVRCERFVRWLCLDVILIGKPVSTFPGSRRPLDAATAHRNPHHVP